MRKTQFLQSLVQFSVSATVNRLCRGDNAREFLGIYPSSPNVTIAVSLLPPASPLPTTFPGVFVVQGPSSGVGWELNKDQHKELVKQEWWGILTGGAGNFGVTVIELLAWDDQSGDSPPVVFEGQAPDIYPEMPVSRGETREEYIGRLLAEAKRMLGNA